MEENPDSNPNKNPDYPDGDPDDVLFDENGELRLAGAITHAFAKGVTRTIVIGNLVLGVKPIDYTVKAPK